jgi:hypothetical protein
VAHDVAPQDHLREASDEQRERNEGSTTMETWKSSPQTTNLTCHHVLWLHKFVDVSSMGAEVCFQMRFVSAHLTEEFFTRLRFHNLLIFLSDFFVVVNRSPGWILEDLSAVTADDEDESWMDFLVVPHESSEVPEHFRAHQARELDAFVVLIVDCMVDKAEQTVVRRLGVTQLIMRTVFAGESPFIFDSLVPNMNEKVVRMKLERCFELQRALCALELPETPIDCESLLAFIADSSIRVLLGIFHQKIHSILDESFVELLLDLIALQLVRGFFLQVLPFVKLKSFHVLGSVAAQEATEEEEASVVSLVVIVERAQIKEHLRADHAAESQVLQVVFLHQMIQENVIRGKGWTASDDWNQSLTQLAAESFAGGIVDFFDVFVHFEDVVEPNAGAKRTFEQVPPPQGTCFVCELLRNFSIWQLAAFGNV